VAAHSENFVILACTVLIRLKGVTDRETDGRTDISTMAKTREALHTVARRQLSFFVSDSNCTNNVYAIYILQFIKMSTGFVRR